MITIASFTWVTYQNVTIFMVVTKLSKESHTSQLGLVWDFLILSKITTFVVKKQFFTITPIFVIITQLYNESVNFTTNEKSPYTSNC